MENEWKNQPDSEAIVRRIPVFFSAGILVLFTLIGIATLAPDLLGGNNGFQKVLSMMVEPYVELMRQSYSKNGEIEYVVFVSGKEQNLPGRVNREAGVRYLREGIVPSTIVVSLSVPIENPLKRLRNLPFTRVVVRNNGLFFCH